MDEHVLSSEHQNFKFNAKLIVVHFNFEHVYVITIYNIWQATNQEFQYLSIHFIFLVSFKWLINILLARHHAKMK